jgi:hypothetical protein
MGASFDKPANIRHFMLRFPRLWNILQDRSLKDTVSFNDL